MHRVIARQAGSCAYLKLQHSRRKVVHGILGALVFLGVGCRVQLRTRLALNLYHHQLRLAERAHTMEAHA